MGKLKGKELEILQKATNKSLQKLAIEYGVSKTAIEKAIKRAEAATKKVDERGKERLAKVSGEIQINVVNPKHPQNTRTPTAMQPPCNRTQTAHRPHTDRTPTA